MRRPLTRVRAVASSRVIDIRKLPPAKFSRPRFEDRGHEVILPACAASLWQQAVITYSIGALGEQNGRDGYDQYFRVQGDRPVAGIKHIARDALVVCRCATTANLPEPGYPWPARQVGAH